MTTILVAHDYAPVRRVIATVLEQEGGYHVLEARDGVEALKLARLEHPALAILDQRMSGLTADEVYAELGTHAGTQDIPVLVMSADPGEDVQGYLLAVGARACLRKPCPPSELMDTVKRLLGK